MANAEFDALMAKALSLADADARREVMPTLGNDPSGRRLYHQPLLAVAVPHHREGVNATCTRRSSTHHYKWSICLIW
jgi:peptide/nickel transport system substrate-binding protein